MVNLSVVVHHKSKLTRVRFDLTKSNFLSRRHHQLDKYRLPLVGGAIDLGLASIGA